MFQNYFVSGILHPFILYTVFGTMIVYFLTKLTIKVLGVRDPRQKIYLKSLTLAVPFIALALFNTAVTRRCIIGLDYNHQTLTTINGWICTAGNFLAYVLTPLGIAALVIAIIKGIVSLYATRRLIKKYGFADPHDYPDLFRIIDNLVEKVGIKYPQIVVTPQRFARSFTFGYKKPVIVLSEGIIKHLDNEELEAVLAHEIAHIVRSDSLFNWLSVFVRDMIFFTPITYLVFYEIMLEKEKAADSLTIKTTQNPLAFGHALIKVWRLSPKSMFSDLALDNFHPNFARGKGSLEKRVSRIINGDFIAPQKPVFLVSLVVLTISLGTLFYIC